VVPVVAPAPTVESALLPASPAALLATLQSLITAIPDSRIQNPVARDALVKRGLAAQSSGFNVVTPKGITYLVDFGLL